MAEVGIALDDLFEVDGLTLGSGLTSEQVLDDEQAPSLGDGLGMGDAECEGVTATTRGITASCVDASGHWGEFEATRHGGRADPFQGQERLTVVSKLGEVFPRIAAWVQAAFSVQAIFLDARVHQLRRRLPDEQVEIILPEGPFEIVVQDAVLQERGADLDDAGPAPEVDHAPSDRGLDLGIGVGPTFRPEEGQLVQDGHRDRPGPERALTRRKARDPDAIRQIQLGREDVPIDHRGEMDTVRQVVLHVREGDPGGLPILSNERDHALLALG